MNARENPRHGMRPRPPRRLRYHAQPLVKTVFPRDATRVLDNAGSGGGGGGGGGGPILPIEPGVWPEGDAVRLVQGDFGCVRDSEGHNQFSPFWFTLLDLNHPLAIEWRNNWHARGYRAAVVSPKYGYPGSPIDGRDFGPERFAELCAMSLDLGMVPMVMLTDYPDEMPKALRVVAELKRRGMLPHVWLSVGWEIVGGGGTYRSKEAYDANWALERACEGVEHYIFAHLQPGRASFASNPVQDDDPWRIWIWDLVYDANGNLIDYQESECGDDAEVQKALHPDGEYATVERRCYHDMPFIRMFCYQTEHEGWHDNPPAWQDRWRDVVPRFVNGMNGWRPMMLNLFETVLWNDYRDEFGPNGEPMARQVAEDGRRIAAEYDGATCTYGNGKPTSQRVVTQVRKPGRPTDFWT